MTWNVTGSAADMAILRDHALQQDPDADVQFDAAESAVQSIIDSGALLEDINPGRYQVLMFSVGATMTVSVTAKKPLARPADSG